MPKDRVWEPIDGGKKFKCKTCDFTADEPGGVQLHFNRRHGGASVKEKQKQDRPATNGHQWRLLRPSDPLEAEAIRQGHTKVCRLCDELEEDEPCQP